MSVPDIPVKERRLIRKHVVSILKNKTLAGARVFPNYSVPPAEEELPVILVYPRSEPVDKYAEAPRELMRNLSLAIEIMASGPEVDEEGTSPADGESLEDILDIIAAQIECAMDEDETLGCTADDSILTDTEFEFDGGGGQPMGSARLIYAVTYNTRVGASKSLGELPDHTVAQVEWDTDQKEPQDIEAEDTIDQLDE